MLHEFVTSNRGEVIRRCREKVAKRLEPTGLPTDVDHGVPLFLQQLVETLRLEQSTSAREGGEPQPTPGPTEIGRGAALHGADLLRLGYSVGQVVHDYGDICQAVTELAVEQKAFIDADEFRTLNRCLDNAIADAVTAFARNGKVLTEDRADDLHKRLSLLADEQRRLVDIAVHAYSAIKTGNVGLTGATGALLDHALSELHVLADRTETSIRPVSSTTAPSRG